MKINLALPYVVREGERADANGKPSYFSHDRQISDYMIRLAIEARYKQGVKEKAVRRQITSVQKILFTAINEKSDTAELSVEQVTFILDTLDAWEAPSFLVSWVEDLTDYLAESKKSTELAAKAEKKSAAAP